MKILLVAIIVLSSFFSVSAQNKKVDTSKVKPVLVDEGIPNDQDTNRLYSLVEEMPKFHEDINKYLANHIQYPDTAEWQNTQGNVYLSFVIEKDGTVSNVRVIRGAASILNREAIRVISQMPKWTPGMQNGKPVRVQFNLPIHFRLT